MAARGNQQDPFEALINTVSAAFIPVIQEGLRRAMGSAMGAAAPGLPSAPRRPSKAPGGTAAPGPCSADGCTNPARCKGLCSKHYQAQRRALTSQAGPADGGDEEVSDAAGEAEASEKSKGRKGKGRKGKKDAKSPDDDSGDGDGDGDSSED